MARSGAPATVDNPFVGLRPFDIGDSALFFGRNEQTYDLLRRLNLLHFIAVIGPSGCGKSSLVRAGVLATLQQGYMAEGGPWKIVTMQPGLNPAGQWKRKLTSLVQPGMDASMLLDRPAKALDTTTGKIAILVDQFEELFQFCDRTGRANEVEAFLNAMLSMGAPDGKIYLILTMRSEYLVRCAVYPALAEAINEGLYLVPRMTREQLRQAIVAPTQKAGATITVALIERLLDDASSEEDGLPVLQHPLMRMWPHRNPFAPLGLDLYPATGGLGAFLDSHAEQVYQSLNADDKLVAEALFRCITERTAEGREVRRAQQLDTIAKITGISAERLLAVIRRYQSEGFLAVIEAEALLIDISHEAVARQWKRFRVAEQAKAKESADELARGGLNATPRYVGGFEKGSKIGLNHFELWLAPPVHAAARPAYAQVVVLYLDPAREDEAKRIDDAVSRFSEEYNVSISLYKAVSWKFINDLELHYFHQEDQAEAEKLTGRLQDSGAFYVKSRFMAVQQQIPLRYFEIWLQGTGAKQ